MDLDLKGRVALITGASQGIGLATAAALARDGAHVALVARTPHVLHAAVEEVRRTATSPARVHGVPVDVRRPAQLTALHAEVRRSSVPWTSWSTTRAPRSADPSSSRGTRAGRTTSI